MSSGPSRFLKARYKLKKSGPYQFAKNLFNFRSTHEHTGQEQYGKEGEGIVQKHLEESHIFAVFERISPQNEKDKPFREIDAIIFDRGILCCVEIKRYKGSIEFTESRPLNPNHRSEGAEDNRPEFEKFYKIKVTKEGKYGEGTFEKVHSNPKLRVKSFLYHFEAYLKKINSPLTGETFHNLLVFIRGDSDITAIHSLEDGIIYHDEITDYIELKSKSKKSKFDSKTIKESLSSLPTWDTVTTRDGQDFYGVLKNDGFTCSLKDSRSLIVPYAITDKITIKHKSRFSPDELSFVSEGKENSYKISNGVIPLYRFGYTDYFKTNSIKKIVMGANTLRERKTVNIVQA